MMKIIFVILPLIALVACDTDPMCTGCGIHGSVNIQYDWSKDPSADPQGMRVAFHPADRTMPVMRYDLPGISGGEIKIGTGAYSVITYNNDTESVQFEDLDDWDNAVATTVETTVTAPMGMSRAGDFRPRPDEAVKRPPEQMWSDYAQTINIDGTSQTITLAPNPMHCEYSFRIRHVSRLESVRYMSAALTGVADAVSLSGKEIPQRHCTISVPAARIDSMTIGGDFLTFGHIPSDTVKHLMELYAVTDDGRQYRFHGDPGTRWDVTAQIANAPDRRHVEIVIDSLEIPAKGTVTPPDEGFAPGADDWQDVHTIIPL